jgi:hypothetical protein
MTSLSENAIIAKYFAYKHLPKVHGEPTYADIDQAEKQTTTNLAKVKTTLGGGHHGMVAINMTPETYATETGSAWNPPDHPGIAPIIPAATSAVESKNITTLYEINLKNANLVADCQDAVQLQLLEAFDEDYFLELRDNLIGYANVTVYEMFQHLYDTCGNQTPYDLRMNAKRINEPYDPATPIIAYFNKVEEICKYATRASDPISPTTVLAAAYVAIQDTNAYDLKIDEWDDKDEDQKTWTNFKAHFTKAYHKYRQKQASVAKAMSNQLNQAQDIQSIMYETLDEFSRTNQLEMANLTTANSALITSNSTLTTRLEQALVDITNLQKDVSNLKKKKKDNGRDNGRGRGNGNTNNTGGGNNSNNGGGNNSNNGGSNSSNTGGSNTYYCWTHGATKNPLDISGNCPNKAPGHKHWATMDRKFGGCEDGC